MVEINIYPTHSKFEYLLDLYPPVLANKFLPQWYKDQKLYYKHKLLDKTDYIEANEKNFRRAKNCPAIQEFLTDGVVVPSWSDMYIHKNNDNSFNWEVELGNINILKELQDYQYIKHHDIKQVEGMNLNTASDYGLLKLISPYNFFTPKGYGLEFSDPFYHHRRNVKILPGKAETDKWHEVNFPFEFYYDLNIHEHKSLMIKAGEPLFVIRPYKIEQENIKLNINKYDQEIVKIQEKNLAALSSVSSNWQRYKKIKEN